MKKKPVLKPAHQNLLAQFKNHLQTLGYSKGTLTNSQNNVRSFLLHIENKNHPEAFELEKIIAKLRDQRNENVF